MEFEEEYLEGVRWQRKMEKILGPMPIIPHSETKEVARPDLIHPFKYQWDHGNYCVHFHEWLGGFVVCGLKENDPLHRQSIDSKSIEE